MLFISDIHGNLPALEQLLKNERYDLIAFLGDAVDYGPWPTEVIDILRDEVDYKVMGNHDSAVAFRIDCMCSQEMHPISVWTREQTFDWYSKEHLDWLRNLPIEVNLEIDGIKIYIVHASPRNHLYGYLKPDMNDEEILELVGDMSEFDYVITAHSHRPFIRQFQGFTFVNDGSVGQPRDGDPRLAYAILDTNTNKIEIKRMNYPKEKTIQRLKELQWPQKLVKLIENGRA